MWKPSSEKKERRGKQNKKPLVITLDFLVLIALQSTRDQTRETQALEPSCSAVI